MGMHKNAKKGIKAYWDAVHRIQKETGKSSKAARAEYARRHPKKAKAKAPKASKKAPSKPAKKHSVHHHHKQVKKTFEGHLRALLAAIVPNLNKTETNQWIRNTMEEVNTNLRTIASYLADKKKHHAQVLYNREIARARKRAEKDHEVRFTGVESAAEPRFDYYSEVVEPGEVAAATAKAEKRAATTAKARATRAANKAKKAKKPAKKAAKKRK